MSLNAAALLGRLAQASASQEASQGLNGTAAAMLQHKKVLRSSAAIFGDGETAQLLDPVRCEPIECHVLSAAVVT